MKEQIVGFDDAREDPKEKCYDRSSGKMYKEYVKLPKDDDWETVADNVEAEEVFSGKNQMETIAELKNHILFLKKENELLKLKAEEETLKKKLADCKTARKSHLKDFFSCFPGISNIVRRMKALDLQDITSISKKSPFTCQKSNFVGSGIVNLGNTCFLSAVLQCLCYTPLLVIAMNSCSHSSNNCPINGFCVVCTFKKHLENVFLFRHNIIIPTEFWLNLTEFSKFFEPGKEQDTHEFHMLFLGKLETALSQNKGANVIGNIFDGVLLNQVKCVVCGYVKERLDPYRDLSLSMAGLPSLNACLVSFMREEFVHYEEHCEVCRSKADFRKRFYIDKIPDISVFQMKRFVDVGGGRYEKIISHLDFPTRLDLGPFVSSKDRRSSTIFYDLYAVIVHSGSCIETGHYLAYVSTGNQWLKMSDENVTVVSEEEVKKQQCYMLFYSKSGIPSLSSVLESWGWKSTED